MLHFIPALNPEGLNNEWEYGRLYLDGQSKRDLEHALKTVTLCHRTSERDKSIAQRVLLEMSRGK